MLAVFVLAFAHFWVRTTPVRFANTDDLVFQDISDRNLSADFTVSNAQGQARFYFASPLFRPALVTLYGVPQPWLFSLLRTAALFAQIGLAGWLVARVTRNSAQGAAFALLFLGTLHIPPTFYPVLSYPCNWLGFCAVLAAVHCHLTYLRRPNPLPAVFTGVFFLLGCQMHEIFIFCLPLFLLLGEPQAGAGWPGRLRAAFAPLTAASGYTAVYLLFARQFPSTYDGTQFSPDLGAAVQVVMRQMVGIIPGFELVVQRLQSEASGPLFREAGAIGRTLLTTPASDLLLGLTEAAALTSLLACAARQAHPSVRRWPWLLACAILLNLPVAFSSKYQVFIFHRQFPYVYAFYASFAVYLVLTGAAIGLLHRAGGWLSLTIVGLLSAALCFSAMASNHQVLLWLQQTYN